MHVVGHACLRRAASFAKFGGMLNGPDTDVARLLDAAKRSYARGDRVNATALARQVLLRRPGEAAALQILGIVALDTGDFAAARRHLEASNSARPDAATFNMIGVASDRMGDAAAARAAFARAGELGLVDGWRNLAIKSAGDERIDAFERALKVSPNDATSHAGLAQALEARHELARAKLHAQAALGADSANSVARLALARVLMREKNFIGVENAVAPVVASARVAPEHKIEALGLMGDARDRRDDARGAFEAFTASNQISLQLNRAWLDASERLYHPESVQRMADRVLSAPAGVPSAASNARAPVFLVGFPRSGTTLLDQVLSSHSGIVCLEEREHFSDALGEVIADSSRATQPDTLTEEELSRIRESYWRRVEAAPAATVIDKYPLNIVVLPLIKRVFPDAKIILALRDPRDVVLSCYQQRFVINAAMAQFLELQRAANYYAQVMSLLELCRARLGLDLHQVRYEDVVGDLGGEARKLCAFLDLSFEQKMLDYRETALKRDIATPSARQVIEPLYQRSVGRWRRYEAELAPVLPTLDHWAELYGYGASAVR